MIRRPTPTLAALALALLIGLPAYALADDDGIHNTKIVTTFGLISPEKSSDITLTEAPGVEDRQRRVLGN